MPSRPSSAAGAAAANSRVAKQTSPRRFSRSTMPSTPSQPAATTPLTSPNCHTPATAVTSISLHAHVTAVPLLRCVRVLLASSRARSSCFPPACPSTVAVPCLLALLALTHARLEQRQEAFATCEEVAASRPTDTHILHTLSLVYRQLDFPHLVPPLYEHAISALATCPNLTLPLPRPRSCCWPSFYAYASQHAYTLAQSDRHQAVHALQADPLPILLRHHPATALLPALAAGSTHRLWP